MASTMTATKMTSVNEVKETTKAADVGKEAAQTTLPQPLVNYDDDFTGYDEEIFDHLRNLEQTTFANPNYMDAQHGLDWEKRGILVDWLIEVHAKFEFLDRKSVV